MALKKLLADLAIISKLGTNPGVDDSLSEEQLKAKFDEAANIIKDYINNYLIPELDKTVDVESLLSDILDTSLTKSNKAANAKSTGDLIRGLRAFFDEVVHSGDYILEADSCFAAEAVSEAVVRVQGGKGVMQGNLFALNIGAYEDVKLLDGTYGLYRNDLIAVRCTKDENGVQSYALVALTGANTSGDPVDPEYAQSNINVDGTERDFPLYRIRFNGYDIVEIVSLFEPQKPLEKHLQKYTDSKHQLLPATISTEWTGETAPYTQVVAVEGITKEDHPHIMPVYSETLEAALLEKEAWAMVNDANTDDGSITFICFEEKPETAINVQIEVNR